VLWRSLKCTVLSADVSSQSSVFALTPFPALSHARTHIHSITPPSLTHCCRRQQITSWNGSWVVNLKHDYFTSYIVSVTELLSRYYCLYGFIYAINRPGPTKMPYTFTLASVVLRVKRVWFQSGRWYQQKTKKWGSLTEAEDSVPRRKGWSGICIQSS
jgi:hypothetical protein